MARIRTVKPELFLHDGLYDLEKSSGLPIIRCWIALFTQADRAGRFEWRPRVLKTQCAPYDDFDFVVILHALATEGYIVRYVVEGREYAYIPTFLEHQCPNVREPASKLPDPTPEAIDAARDTSRCDKCTMHAHACTCKNIPAHGEWNGNGMEWNGNGFGEDEPRNPEPDPQESDLPEEPEPEPQEAPPKVKAEQLPIPQELDTPEFRDVWLEWIVQRRIKRLSVRPDYMRSRLTSFVKHGLKASVAAMRECIEQDYQGCFPENFDRNGFKRKGAKNGTDNRTGAGQRFVPQDDGGLFAGQVPTGTVARGRFTPTGA